MQPESFPERLRHAFRYYSEFKVFSASYVTNGEGNDRISVIMTYNQYTLNVKMSVGPIEYEGKAETRYSIV